MLKCFVAKMRYCNLGQNLRVDKTSFLRPGHICLLKYSIAAGLLYTYVHEIHYIAPLQDLIPTLANNIQNNIIIMMQK